MLNIGSIFYLHIDALAKPSNQAPNFGAKQQNLGKDLDKKAEIYE